MSSDDKIKTPVIQLPVSPWKEGWGVGGGAGLVGLQQRNAFQTHCTKPYSDENNFYHLGILKRFGMMAV